MACDVEIGEQSHATHDQPAVPAGFLSQAGDAPQSLPPQENDLKVCSVPNPHDQDSFPYLIQASVSEVCALAATLRNENAELERRLNAQLEDVTLKVMLKISLIESTMTQRSAGHPPQNPGLGRVPVDGGDDNFKVISSVSRITNDRTHPVLVHREDSCQQAAVPTFRTSLATRP